MGEETEAFDTQISRLSITEIEQRDENTLIFLDSVDNYLILIETLSSTLRKGWLELASARHSMGASRVNTALLSLKPHSAATSVEIDYDNAVPMKKSPRFSLCKWAPSDEKDASVDKENNEEDELLKEDSRSSKLEPHTSPLDSENEESSLKSNNGSETKASPPESNGSETKASPPESNGSETKASPPESNGSKNKDPPCKTESTLQKERAKVRSVFGTLVSPKLRTSQLSFETALETLVEIANLRSSILKAHDALQKEMKSSNGF